MNEITTLDTISNSTSDIEREEIEIESGQYWQCDSLLSRSKRKKTLLLIESLNIIDGILHSVELAPHPLSRNQKSTRIMTDDFLEKFEFVPLEEAEKIRAEEINEVNEELNALREELLIGYVDESGNMASKMLQNASNNKENAENLPVQASRNIDAIKENANSLVEVAKKQAGFIKEKNHQIVKCTEKLASLYKEKGTQALASVDGTMKFVQKLNSGIETLDLYTGKDVEYYQFAEGEEASKDEPLTFYQRKLYFDEEVFANLADGGSDFNSIGSFSDYLKEDDSLLNRLIPSQRGVVLMQIRRKDKKYYSDKELSESMANRIHQAQMNEANKECFLLLRNGKNVYLIESEFLTGGERLFPTAKEISGLYTKTDNEDDEQRFKGIDGKIKPSELKYVESRSSHDNKTVYYKRILVLLSGLYEREPEIFGEFIDSNKYIGSWYNIDFQKKCCRFIYDDEDALDFNSQSFTNFIEEKNQYLRSGSRIVFISHKLLNGETAPILFKGDYWKSYHVTDSENYKIAKRDSNKYILEFNVEKDCWSYEKGSYVSKRVCKVDLNSEHIPTGAYLVVDAITSSELKAFIDSRKQRAFYLEYMELFLELYRKLKNEEENQECFVEMIRDSIKGYYENIDTKKVGDAISEAIRIYRADNKGMDLNLLFATKGYEHSLNAIGKIIDATLAEEKRLKRIIDSFEDNNIKESDVIRIVIDAKGKYYIYAELQNELKYGFLEYSNPNIPYPMIYKYQVKILKTKITISNPSIVYDRYIGIEKVLYEKRVSYTTSNFHLRINHPKKKSDYSSYSYTKIDEYAYDLIEKLKIASIKSQEILNEALSEDGLSRDNIDALLHDVIIKNKNTKYFSSENIILPLAIYGMSSECEIKEEVGMYDYKYSQQVVGMVFIGIKPTRFVGAYAYGENRDYAKEKLRKIRYSNQLGESIKYFSDLKPHRNCMSFQYTQINIENLYPDFKFNRNTSLFSGYVGSTKYSNLDFKFNEEKSKVEFLTYKEQFDNFITKQNEEDFEFKYDVLYENEKLEYIYDLLRDDEMKCYCKGIYTLVETWYSELSIENKKELLYLFFKHTDITFPRVQFKYKDKKDKEHWGELRGVKKNDNIYEFDYSESHAVGFIPNQIDNIRG